MAMLRRYGVIFLLIISHVIAQEGQDYNDYQDYQDQDYQDQGYASDSDAEDNLYQDYAQNREEKEYGERNGVVGIGGLLRVAFITSVGSYYAGASIHSTRARKKLKTKFDQEQKALYTQYYDDVNELTNKNNEISYMVEKLKSDLKDRTDKAEFDAYQRDYEEFKQPDIDGDDRISRAEFSMYVENYLSNYPGLQEKDHPKFEDFDYDGDGYLSFKEYAQQMTLQVQQTEANQ